MYVLNSMNMRVEPMMKQSTVLELGFISIYGDIVVIRACKDFEITMLRIGLIRI